MFAAVALGAFGAHALSGRLDAHATALWHTAVEYQAWHALALLATGILMRLSPAQRGYRIAAWLFAAGIVLFSGGLYELALTGTRFVAVLTPVGGVAFLAGWAVLAWAAWRG